VTPGSRRIGGFTNAWLQPAWQGIWLNPAGVLVACPHRHRSAAAAERCARREARFLRPERDR